MKSKTINVVIPVYNAESTIRRCLDSVFSQKDVVISVILVVQESDDKSLIICREYEKKHNNCFLIETPRDSGVSYNRNLALNRVQSGFVAFIDSDDSFFDNHSLSKLLINSDYDNFVCGNRLLVENAVSNKAHNYYHSKYSTTLVDALDDSKKANHLFDSTQGKLYSSTIIRNNNITFPESLRLGEDNIFNYSYCAHINTITVTDDIIVKDYVDNKSSLSRSYNRLNDIEYMKIYEIVKKMNNKLIDYYVWEQMYWNIISFYRLMKEKDGICVLNKSVRTFYKRFWVKAIKEYRRRIIGKRKYLLNFHFLFIFCLFL